MLSEFFINSVVDNLKILEKQSLKLKDDVELHNNLSKEEANLLNKILDKDFEILSNLNKNKIIDEELNYFSNSLEFKNLKNNLDNIFTILNNNLTLSNNKIEYFENNSNVIYDFVSNQIIGEEIRKLEMLKCLQDENLFKTNNVDMLLRLLHLKDNELISSRKIQNSINNNKETIYGSEYTNNEIKIMSEMVKGLIAENSEDIEDISNVNLIAARFTSATEQSLLGKSGYRETSFNQYLRGTNTLHNLISNNRTGINNSQVYRRCHSNCHSNCHGSRGWR